MNPQSCSSIPANIAPAETSHSRILILRNDHLGDLILTTGLLRNLSISGFKVDIICKDTWIDLFDNNPYVKAYSFGRDGVPPLHKTFALASWIRARKYDYLFLPQRLRQLLLVSALSGVRNRWAQMAGILGRLTFHKCLRTAIVERPRHMADVWLDFARRLKIAVDDGYPEIFLSDAEQAQVRALSYKNVQSNEYVVVHAFHGNSSCNWPVEKYGELARRIELPIVFSGVASERRRIEDITASLKNTPYWNSCGQLTLRQFFALISNAKAIVCSSTGALHAATALGTPSVSLFCPHPFVGPALWSSFDSHSTTLCPEASNCPRFRDNSIRDCGFRDCLSVEKVTKAVLKTAPRV